MRGTHADYSRRLGPVFAEQASVANLTVPLPKIPRMEDHKEQHRLKASEGYGPGACSAKAYKPTHGGYPTPVDRIGGYPG